MIISYENIEKLLLKDLLPFGALPIYDTDYDFGAYYLEKNKIKYVKHTSRINVPMQEVEVEYIYNYFCDILDIFIKDKLKEPCEKITEDMIEELRDITKICVKNDEVYCAVDYSIGQMPQRGDYFIGTKRFVGEKGLLVHSNSIRKFKLKQFEMFNAFK